MGNSGIGKSISLILMAEMFKIITDWKIELSSKNKSK